MKEVKDPEITLFGRKIVMAESGGGGESSDESGGGGGANNDECGRCSEVTTDGKGGERIQENQVQTEEVQVAELCDTEGQSVEESRIRNTVSEGDENPKKNLSNSDENPETLSADEDGTAENHTKTESEGNDASNGQQKTLKKPDKILPCPRCNSMETKFCYFNNYNINQPRHFCKSCQRYWTAGGMMRNVPVGAGRRKNKNSASHYRHITISEALEATRIDSSNGLHHQAFKLSGNVLSFGATSVLCDSMVTGFNLADKRVPNGVRSGQYEVDHQDSVSCKNEEDCSVGSSAIMTNSTADGSKLGVQQPVMQNINGFQSPVSCIPGSPWPLPLNSAVPFPSIYPMAFYPAPYWNCGLPNAWSVPWPSISSPTANQKPNGSCPNSPLGKHSRNGELIKHVEQQLTEPKDSENVILVPKTLRIDDPEEAAKSSIWETLGIKHDSTARGGLFKALQPKGNEKKVAASLSPALQANPAALSRSINFHEGA